MKSTVSVVIPCHNSGPYLSRTIGSALSQTIKPLEIIVVDDGSTDQSHRILESYQNLIVVIRQKNLGVSWARNRGIKEAKGDWIAFLDSDDIWDKRHLEISTRSLSKSEGDLSYCSLSLFDSKTERSLGVWGPDSFDLDIFPKSLFNRNYIAPSGVVIKKEILQKYSFREEQAIQSCEDHDLWLTLVSKGAKFVYVPEVKVLYRKNHAGAATGNRERMLLADIEVMKKHFKNPVFKASTKLQGLSQNYFLLAEEYWKDNQKRNPFLFLKSWIYWPMNWKILKRLFKLYLIERRPGLSRRLSEN